MTTLFHKSFPPLVAMLLATGCAVGPHYKSPKPDAVKFHAADANLVTQQPFNTRWWNQFEDPILDSLVDRSLASNNGIRIARARLAEARAIFDERKLDRFPTVPVTASYQHSKEQIPGFGDQRRRINNFTAGFDAFWEADLFGRVSHGIAATRAENQAFEADLHDVQVSVVSELARNYFELRGAQWRLAVADRSLTNHRESRRLSQLPRDAGVGEEQDVASAAARVAVIESTIPSFEFDVSRAEYRLAVLTGARPGELNADLTPRDYPAIAKALPIGNPGELLQRRPHVRSSERLLAAATERQGLAVAGLFPQPSVPGCLAFVAGRRRLFFPAAAQSWTASPAFSRP